MSSPRRTLPRALRLPSVLVVAALVAGVALGACSSGGSSSADATEAAAAAAVVSTTFQMPDSAKACLEEKLAADGTARKAVTSTEELSASQREALYVVLTACITPDQWAQAIAGRITAAVPPADTAKLTTQVACLTSAVQALDDVQRQALVVGLVVVGSAPQTGELAVQRGDVLNGLYTKCSVVVGASSASSTVPRG
jgi:hypothetical protein